MLCIIVVRTLRVENPNTGFTKNDLVAFVGNFFEIPDTMKKTIVPNAPWRIRPQIPRPGKEPHVYAEILKSL